MYITVSTKDIGISICQTYGLITTCDCVSCLDNLTIKSTVALAVPYRSSKAHLQILGRLQFAHIVARGSGS